MPFEGVYALRVESLRDLLEIYDRELTMVEREMHRRFKDHVGYRAIQAIPGVRRTTAAIMGRDRRRDPVPDRPASVLVVWADPQGARLR
jgi:hypothetical protein